MTRRSTTYDRFTDTSLFTPYDDNGFYARRNVSTDRGRLRLNVEAGNALSSDYGRGAGGWLGPKAITYGRFELGIQAIGGSGTGLVVLLWPTSDVWAEGEVDAFEADFDALVDVNVHRRIKGREAEVGYQVHIDASWREHHLYGITWQPGLLAFDIDGVEVGRIVEPASLPPAARLVPSTPHRLTVQTAPQPGSAAGTVLIDTVRIEAS